uniref:Uncharacterized protein n=1 Tax=Rhizophora mucronata TaxID=61149 RepID=A0A2P2ITM1_RHIMU
MVILVQQLVYVHCLYFLLLFSAIGLFRNPSMAVLDSRKQSQILFQLGILKLFVLTFEFLKGFIFIFIYL